MRGPLARIAGHDKGKPEQEERKATNRLEALTDSAFAFALTLLVIASGPPRSFDELAQALKTIPAFFASATLLMVFWHGHAKWSRRYSLDDAKSVILTCAAHLHRHGLRLPAAAGRRRLLPLDHPRLPERESHQLQNRRRQYDFPGLRLRLRRHVRPPWSCLYRHAAEKTEELGLGPLDRFDAESHAKTYLILAGSGIRLDPHLPVARASWASIAGWAYMPLAFLMPWWGKRTERERQRLAAQLAAEKEAVPDSVSGDA